MQADKQLRQWVADLASTSFPHRAPPPPQADKQLRQWVADLASISSARAEPAAGAGPPPPGRELDEGLSPLEVRKLKVCVCGFEGLRV